MSNPNKRSAPADALVFFGVTGDLAHKMISPALYAMTSRGVLSVPVIGVASSQWSLAHLRKHAKDSIRQAGKIDDRNALSRLLTLLRYVDGDYNDPAAFTALKQALGEARRRAHFLAIPPAPFPKKHCSPSPRKTKQEVHQYLMRLMLNGSSNNFTRAGTTLMHLPSICSVKEPSLLQNPGKTRWPAFHLRINDCRRQN